MSTRCASAHRLILGISVYKKFSDGTHRFGSKIRQREGARDLTEQKLTYYLTMKVTFNLNKTEIHDNTTEDNITVTSSNVSQNDGTVRILKDFEKLTYLSNHEDDIQS